jgi:hypothetical protein
MAIFIVPALVLILGAFVYVLSSTNPKAAELGRIAYLVGLFWAVFLVAHNVVHLP